MSIYIGPNEISSLKKGTSDVSEVYVGDTKIRPINSDPFDTDWDNYDTLYSGANGDIIHGYSSSSGEIRLRDSDGNKIIIADRNLGATNVGDYGYYCDTGLYDKNNNTRRTMISGYHLGSKSEWEGLLALLQSITGGSDWGNMLLIPKAGYWHPSYKYVVNAGTRAMYWTSTSRGSYQRMFDTGGISYGSTNGGASIRPFKDV